MADTTSSLPRFFMGLIAGGLVLLIIHLVMSPMPVAAGPAFAAGVVGFLFSRLDTQSLVVLLAAAGAGIGVVIHRNMHLSGQSPPPEEMLLQHLGVEGLIGYIAALVSLLVMGAVMRTLEKK